MALNNIIVMGRVCDDITLRHTQQGTAVTSFTIAVDRDFEKGKTDFIDCVAWRNTAEFVSKYFGKGRMIAVVGKLQMRDWTDKEGNKRRNAEIIADNVYFADSKNSNADPIDNLTKFGIVEDEVLDSDLPF